MPSDEISRQAGHAGEQVPLARIMNLVPVIDELDRRGPRADALLGRYLMTRAELAEPYREVPLARFVQFLEEAAIVEGDDLLGAKVGGQFRPGSLGPVGLLFGASSTLRRGLDRLVRWLRAWQGGTAVGVGEEDGTLVWSYRLEAEIWPRRQDTGMTLAATIALSREAFGASGRPLEIHIEHSQPEDPAPLARILGVRPLFGQPAAVWSLNWQRRTGCIA